ncbi:riboflavin synthase [Thermoactinomyces mirandus]|uniref:Riboflavin synthase n=1 Tax=Thermoactinomyces mirandus TaxID=2756294 RepID=A0A7W2AQ01_9BACL|nr:riboflavin synthase [Thermoactinomyces mirandus]MBA4600968.1 riboflavin synthase [Thermoactinomyces mirandus]
MFTGIVEEVGRVKQLRKTPLTMELKIECRHVLEGTRSGDSIAVNGVCLTVTEMGSDHFTADAMPETMKRTNLGKLNISDTVNLERAVAAGQRMGGHFVQGHVDGVGTILSVTPYENAVLFHIKAGRNLTRYMIEKGSIAVNGISLTIVEVGATGFSVSLIPHTIKNTQLRDAKQGDLVNIEVDMIGKYLNKWLEEKSGSTGTLTWDHLKEHGFIK